MVQRNIRSVKAPLAYKARKGHTSTKRGIARSKLQKPRGMSKVLSPKTTVDNDISMDMQKDVVGKHHDRIYWAYQAADGKREGYIDTAGVLQALTVLGIEARVQQVEEFANIVSPGNAFLEYEDFYTLVQALQCVGAENESEDEVEDVPIESQAVLKGPSPVKEEGTSRQHSPVYSTKENSPKKKEPVRKSLWKQVSFVTVFYFFIEEYIRLLMSLVFLRV